MCPVHWANIVTETVDKAGASLTQQGFVHHKQELRRKQSEKPGYITTNK